MRPFVAPFLVAALIAAVTTPTVRNLALRLGGVSRPGGRQVQAWTIPRLGDLAICLGFCAPLLPVLLDVDTLTGLRTALVPDDAEHEPETAPIRARPAALSAGHQCCR